MNRLLGILTSRWMYLVVIALAIAAGRTGNHGLLIVLYLLTGVIVAVILWASVPVWRNLIRAWRKYPDTPEAEAYARHKEAELKKTDKNKIELK